MVVIVSYQRAARLLADAFSVRVDDSGYAFSVRDARISVGRGRLADTFEVRVQRSDIEQFYRRQFASIRAANLWLAEVLLDGCS